MQTAFTHKRIYRQRNLPLSFSLQQILGGEWSQKAWVWTGAWFAFAKLLCFPVLSLIVLSIPFYLLPKASTTAKIVAVTQTRYALGDGDDDPNHTGPRCYAFAYTFQPRNAPRKYHGTSYSYHSMMKLGDTVSVTYVTLLPSLSCLEDCQLTPGIVAMALGWIMFILGILAIRARLRIVVPRLRLVSYGTCAKGVLTTMEAPENSDSDFDTMVKAGFSFTAADGKTYQAIAETTRPKRAWYGCYYTDPPKQTVVEDIIYDPDNPTHALVIAQLTHNVYIDKRGQIRGITALHAAQVLIVPLLAVLLGVCSLFWNP